MIFWTVPVSEVWRRGRLLFFNRPSAEELTQEYKISWGSRISMSASLYLEDFSKDEPVTTLP